MRRCIWRLGAPILLATLGYSQTSRGTVSGTVTDPSGAVVSAAAVEVSNFATGVKLSSATNDAGLYRFDALDPGTYNLKVAHSGFHTYVASGMPVKANRTSVVDVRLEVGSETTSVEVSADAEILAKDGPLRGGNFSAADVTRLPLNGLEPMSLARVLPGVISPSGSTVAGLGGGAPVQFAVNGQRTTGNNYLLDGTENNDIEFTGVAQPFHIADAVEEISVQTANFSAEFGRAAGGILNVITRSGTNAFHGTAFWRYQSERFDSIDPLNRLEGTPQSVFVRNVPGFTAGGPIRKDKTFFFAGYQKDTNHSTTNFPLVVPTAAAVNTLHDAFAGNPRLQLYLNALGTLRGTGAPISEALGADTGGLVQFATASLSSPKVTDEPEWLARVDEYLSDKHRLSARFTYDSSLTSPVSVYFPGFVTDTGENNRNFLLSDSYTPRPDYTNELRVSYGRLYADQSSISAQSVAEAKTLPQIELQNGALAAPGVPSGLPFRHANNFLVQETQTRLWGRHTFRFGLEWLRQLATQGASGYPLGQIIFDNSPGYSSFVNFLEDYSGQPGRIRLTIGGNIFHPNEFRQSYFFQDTWKATASLTLTMGLRYENFGQPANALRYPAFSGFNPANFFQPNHVDTDDRDFGPAFGFAWSPHGSANTVVRGGYQISYSPLYTQALGLDLSTATPNAISIDERAQNTTGRGDPGWYEELPFATTTPSLTNAQYGTIEKHFRTPYTERWSLGIQRRIGQQILVDLSYVGAESHKLTTRADLNPSNLAGVRPYPAFGDRTVRTSQGNSSYGALQAKLDHRFAHGFQITAAYTWSKSMDSTSEGIGQVNGQYGNANLTSIPISQGGLKLDRAVSDFDRTQLLTILYVWAIPGPVRGIWNRIAGGWSLAGITSFQSGTPFTMLNGFDRNGDGWPEDRPDIGNPNAPLNTRAISAAAIGAQSCASGYLNPDTGQCTSPQAVHWLEGSGLPNASTLGRNTMRTGGTNDFDASLFKTFGLGARSRIEVRCEAQNAFNHPQYVQVPPMDVVNSPSPQFMNRAFTDPGIRSLWVQAKLLW